MSLNDTPSGERIHIGFFGVRNAGKSSLVNRITNQQMSLVSDHLTHLVGYGWFGRWLWMFGWFAALALLWKFARGGLGAAGGRSSSSRPSFT